MTLLLKRELLEEENEKAKKSSVKVGEDQSPRTKSKQDYESGNAQKDKTNLDGDGKAVNMVWSGDG